MAAQPLIISPCDSPQMQHVALSPSGEARRLGLAFAAGSMPSTAPAPRRNAIVVGRAVLAVPQLTAAVTHEPLLLGRWQETDRCTGQEAGKGV